MTLDPDTVTTYLCRIGVDAPTPDLDALRTLQNAHVLTVPFENVDCFLRTPLRLGAGAVEKVTRRGRGGGCYELNSAIGLLLEALGYPVTVLGARVFHGDIPMEPLRHLVLVVEAPEPHLVDVGFGFGAQRNPRLPLRFDARNEQVDPHGRYRLVDASDGDVDLFCDDRPLYRIERHPRRVEDFELSLWWFHTAAGSPMLRALFCVLPTPDGRVSLKDTTLIRTSGGVPERTELADRHAVREVLAREFGVTVGDLDDLGRPPDELGALLAAQITAEAP